MSCSKCSAINPYNAVQCSNCGADLAAAERQVFARPNAAATAAHRSDAEEYYEAAVGFKKADYYLPRFARFDAEGVGISWNWAAFWVSFFWLLHRKMWLWALLYFLLPMPLNVLQLVSQPAYFVASLLYLVGVLVVFPMYANALYHAQVKKKIQKAKAYSADRQKQLQILAAEGGTSIAGWIAALLLGGVAVIGILAAIAIPAYQDYVMKAKVAAGVALGEGYEPKVENYVRQTQNWPRSLDDIGGVTPAANPNAADITLGDNGTIIIIYNGSPMIDGKSVALVPSVDNANHIVWTCKGMGFAPKYLPPQCRG